MSGGAKPPSTGPGRAGEAPLYGSPGGKGADHPGRPACGPLSMYRSKPQAGGPGATLPRKGAPWAGAKGRVSAPLPLSAC